MGPKDGIIWFSAVLGLILAAPAIGALAAGEAVDVV